jgi:hypothetical protein
MGEHTSGETFKQQSSQVNNITASEVFLCSKQRKIRKVRKQFVLVTVLQEE